MSQGHEQPTEAPPHDRPYLAGAHDGRQADEYARYLYEHGIRPLEEKALGVQLLREDRATESEFVTISYWESVEARDPEFLIELPSGVQVLEIVTASGRTGGDA